MEGEKYRNLGFHELHEHHVKQNVQFPLSGGECSDKEWFTAHA